MGCFQPRITQHTVHCTLEDNVPENYSQAIQQSAFLSENNHAVFRDHNAIYRMLIRTIS